MGIDLDLLSAAQLPPIDHSWRPEDVVLYHLGIGAGLDPLDPAALRYSYENDLVVLPSFSALAIMPLLLKLGDVPGFDVPLAKLLHAEHEVELEAPLPARAQARTESAISTVGDLGSGVLLGIESITREAEGGAVLARNLIRVMARGEGPTGQQAERFGLATAPEREPDLTLTRETLPWQALLYRLSGDTNPLHADPEVAERAGFERPILHGLCTYGAVLHALVDAALDGAVERARNWRARFVGVVYPGESLRIQVWREDEALVAKVTGVESERDVLIGNLRSA